MLQPTRTKYRKAHKGRIHGNAGRGEIFSKDSNSSKKDIGNATTNKNKI